MSLSSLGSLASTAFDTARSTFKAVADAAAPPATETRPAKESQVTPSAEAFEAATADSSTPVKPTPVKGQRLGTVLDAYA